VILLNLNPGHSDADAHDYQRPIFRQALLNNLRQVPQPYPFYPLNPSFIDTGAGQWWSRRLRTLQNDAGIAVEEFTRRLMVIEWFPYHSRSFSRPRKLFPSQAFSFQLAKAMLQEGRLVITMRSKKLWQEVDPRFGNIDALSNPRCGYVSRKNAATCYQAILDRITAGGDL
jgi:hypothetical protein